MPIYLPKYAFIFLVIYKCIQNTLKSSQIELLFSGTKNKNRNNVKLNTVRQWMLDIFEKDYNDLSDKTKEIFNDEYKQILKIVLGKNI